MHEWQACDESRKKDMVGSMEIYLSLIYMKLGDTVQMLKLGCIINNLAAMCAK